MESSSIYNWIIAMIVVAAIIGYVVLAIVNYLLIGILAKYLNKLIFKKQIEGPLPILRLALPFFIAAVLLYNVLIRTINFIVPGFNQLNLFWQPYHFYVTGFIGYSISNTCLWLTGFSFTKQWEMVARLSRKKTVMNFIIWGLLNVALLFVCDRYIRVYIFFSTWWLVYPVLVIAITFLFLKWRAIAQATDLN